MGSFDLSIPLMSLGVLFLLINKGGSFTVPVAFIVSKRVTLFFDFLTPLSSVFEGSNSQNKPNKLKYLLVLYQGY